MEFWAIVFNRLNVEIEFDALNEHNIRQGDGRHF